MGEISLLFQSAKASSTAVGLNLPKGCDPLIHSSSCCADPPTIRLLHCHWKCAIAINCTVQLQYVDYLTFRVATQGIRTTVLKSFIRALNYWVELLYFLVGDLG